VRALSQPLGPAEPSALLSRADFDQWLARVNAQPHAGDGGWWVRYGKDHSAFGEPWFSVFATPREGPLRHVELSASFTNAQFMRNMLDMCDEGLRLSRRLDAKLYEETRGTELNLENVDAFLDFKGPFVTGQHKFFLDGQAELRDQPYAPLEFPLGAIDQVSDYFRFDLRTKDVPTIEDLVAQTPAHLDSRPRDDVELVLYPKQGKQSLVRVVLLDEGLVVRPAWSRLPFAQLAGETLRTVDRLEQQLSASVTYRGAPVTAAQRATLEPQTAGLGVSFYEWLHGAQ
jgi:hypothetical protein